MPEHALAKLDPRKAFSLNRGCPHPGDRLKITARGKSSLIVVCQCGASTLFIPVPVRRMSSAETDLMIAMAREAQW